MVFDKKIEALKQHFQITRPEHWQNIPPAWIIGLDGYGPVILDHIRLYLAGRGLTLRNDQTPQFWQEHLSEAKVGHQMGSGDRSVVTEFVILADTREQQPFTFEGLTADFDQGGRPMLVPVKFQSLGDGWGDYSLEGLEGQVHVERKSLADAHGTILGWGPRREQFEQTMANLAGIECAAIVVEASFGQLVSSAPSRGKKSAKENAKILHRQVMAWHQDYRIPWFFCDNRRFAEITTFQTLARYWRKHGKRKAVEDLDSVIATL